ncbi:hypothetical protein GLOTRDRAFT_17563, partial [Gloeophyllum trabeum ATCC 11539]
MSSDLHTYISDNVIQFFGLSDKAIIDYIIASASSAKSAESLFSTLSAYGLPATPAAQNFVTEVYSRVPRKTKHKKADDLARKQAEKESQALRTQKYSFVLDDD